MGMLDDLRRELPEFAGMADHEVVHEVSRRLGEDPAAVAHELGIRMSQPGFGSAFATGLSQFPQGAGRLIEDVGPQATEGLGRGLRHYGEDVQFRNPTSVHNFEDFAQHPWQGVKELVGQAAGSTLPAMIPYVGPVARGLGTVGTVAAGTAAAALPSYGGIRATQDQTGAQNIPMALGGALASGAIEQMGGLQRVFRPGGEATNLLSEMGRTPLRSFGKATLRTGLEEGAEELAQNPIEQYAGGQNPMDPAQLADTAFSGFGGFVGGIPLGMVGGARLGLRHQAANQFIGSHLENPDSPMDSRLQALEMQQTLMGGGQDAQAWAENMRTGFQEDQNRMRAQQLAQGAPFDLLNLGNDLSILDQQQAPAQGEPAGSIYDTINQNQGALQGMPHAAPAMQPGTAAEPPINRAASIYANLHGQNLHPQSQEAQDYDWASKQLQQGMSPQAFSAFEAQLAMDRLAGQRPKIKPNAAPQANKGRSAGSPVASPAAAAPQTLGGQFKAAGGRSTNVIRALDAAKDPTAALDLVRQQLEKPDIASSTLRALEELHKQITGITYEQHLRQQEAADVRQGGSSEAVPTGNGQAQGAQPGTQVQPASAQGARPAQQRGQGGAAQVYVSDPARRAQLAQTVVKELRPEDQEVLGFLQQHGEKAFEPLGQKWGITRQAARQRVYGVRDREGNVRQVGIVDRIANIVGRHGLTMEDFLKAYEPRVYESDAARTGLSPKLNESKLEEEALHDESAVEQGTGTVASAGGSQSDWRESRRDEALAKEVPGYAEKLAEERNQPPAESAHQEHLTAAEGEKVDERIAGREDANAEYTSAEQWWDQERDNSAQIPKFEDLADRHQEEVIQAVKSGEANGRLQKRVVAEFNEPSYFSKGRPITLKEWQETGDAFRGAASRLREAGLKNVWEHVREIRVEPLGSDTFGRITIHQDRTFTVRLNEELVAQAATDPEKSEILQHTLLHELSHAVDASSPVQISDQPAFALTVKDGVVTPTGQVVKELVARWKEGSPLGLFLDYPLDAKQFPNLSNQVLRMEIWAQLQAAWLTPDGRITIQSEAPTTAAFMREANAYLRSHFETLTPGSAAAAGPAQGRGVQPAGVQPGASAQVRAQQPAAPRTGRTDAGKQDLENRSAPLARAQAEVTTRLGDVWAKFKPTLLTLHQLVDQFGDKLQTLKDYTLSMDKMEQRHHEILNRAHKVILDWQKLDTRERQQLDSVMQRATMRGIHPDEPFGTGPNDHLTDQAEYDTLKRAYDALPANAKATYKAVRTMLDENWAARKAAFARSATHAYEKLIADAAGDQARVAELTKERDKIIADHAKAISDLKGPYFPLLRFGDYLTIARSKELAKAQDDLENATGPERTALQKRIESLKKQAQHYAVEAHENRAAAESSAAQYKARGMDARAQLAEEHHRSLQPMAAGAIDKIASGISDQFDKATAAKLKHAITELYISSLPEHAALQRQLKRKGIEGATEDMLRAVAKAVEKDSFYLARLEYSDEIADNLFKLKTEAKKAGIDYQHVYNNLAARLALDFEYKPTPVQNALAKLSAVWHLGMSPAYLLTNATQPWMITAPVLAGRFGAGRSFAALRSAWVDAARIIKQSKAGGAFADIDFKSVGDTQERDMLERIVQRGQIDITQNVDMGLVAEGTDPKYLKAQKVFNWANQHVEASNRITTALASYRLARQRGMSHDDAADFAYKAVVDTQLDYSNANAAYWMKSGAVPLGKLIFQFRKYQQGMLYLMARNAQLAFKGDKDALRSLGYLATMQLAFAGAAGIPVVMAPLAAFGLFVGGGDDEKGDAETQLRNYLTDMMGADAARAFWKGLPTLMGLDVSQRVGMGDFWKPLPYLKLNGKTGADDVKNTIAQTLGAPFGTLMNFADSMNFFGKGDWMKGTEKLLPKMLADPLKAARYADQGITSRSGNQVLTPEKIDGWDIALRAAGFSPTVESEHYAAAQSKDSTAQAIKDRRDNLLAKYAQTKQRGEDTAAALEAINKFNQDHPTAAYRIDRSSMLKAVQSRRKGAGELDEAGVRFSRKDKPLRGIDRYAYGA